MDNLSFKVAYLTAGAAGMYCGSCMHDNTLAAALMRKSVDVQLIPTYTPIRTDEENISVDQVFFGGINVFLQQKLSLFRYLPRSLDRILDRPGLIRWITKRASSTDPKKLGPLTISMLQGKQGFQRKEVDRLCAWLSGSFRPDLVNLSNVLIAGCVPELRARLKTPVLITLQGDDIFLDELPNSFRVKAIQQIRRIDESVDGYVVFSRYYADFMTDYLGLNPNKFHLIPLGIDTRDLAQVRNQASEENEFVIGYLARMAPEKGLHLLVDAFIQLHSRHGLANTKLFLAGWLGEHRKDYLSEQLGRLDQAGLGDKYQYFGSVDRAQKLDFLSRLHLLSVPAVYRDPKGLFVLEALAAGVPVVQPDHGAFSELLESTKGGILCRPGDAADLADKIASCVADRGATSQRGMRGRQLVLSERNAETMADQTIQLYRRFLGSAHN